MLSLPASQSFVRANTDPSRMWKMYAEYADIAVADDVPYKSKERLNALSSFAETEGLTGQAALEGLRCLLMDLQLLDARRFSLFYRFVFFICRERGQKNLPVHLAVEAWKLSLSGRFRLLDQWCVFVQYRDINDMQFQRTHGDKCWNSVAVCMKISVTMIQKVPGHA